MSKNVNATLKELEHQRAQIEAAIASLRALNGNGGGTGQTIVGAAVAHLKKVGATQTSRQLREAILAAGVQATPGSIQTILSKRSRAKKDLVKKGRAVWTLRTRT